jgi:alpha-beta hydrolase superfamily lysophospholipase
MDELMARAKEIDAREYCSLDHEVWADSPAIKIIHGSSDRATSHLGTLKLFGMLPHEDKEIEIYEGYEHGTYPVSRVRIDS